MKKKDLEKKAINDPGNKYLLKQHNFGEKLIFITYEGRIEGTIEEVLKYELKLKGRDELLPKLDILFLYKPDTEAGVTRILETNEDVQKENLKPVKKFRERLKIRPAVLSECQGMDHEIKVILRNGQVLTGKIHSFGIFSIRLDIGENSRVVIMKPNIYGLKKRTANACRGNVKTGVFHFAGCRYFGNDDCTAVFGSPEEAVKAGFRPHKQCNTRAPEDGAFTDIDTSSQPSGNEIQHKGVVPVLEEGQNHERREKVKGNLNVTVKINQLPRNTELVENNRVRFVIDAAGRDVQVALRPKVWNKLVEASKNFPQWVAVITGDMGENIKGGFVLENPGMQVFEKKPKEPKTE